MKIGILESQSNRFILDVIARLGKLQVEFLSLGEHLAPLSSEYRVIVDRLSFQSTYLKEVMKAFSLDGSYVINNPFAATATNKLVDMKVCSWLGIPFPKTIVLPGTAVQEGAGGVVAKVAWERVAQEIGFPCVLKPFDGYAWQDVYVANSVEEARNLHNALRHREVLLAQQLIRYEHYYRVFCIDKRDILFIKWVPKPFGLGEYLQADLKPIEALKEKMAQLTIQLNLWLDLDVNVVEWCVDADGRPWVIDAFNEVPDVRSEVFPPECYRWVVDRFVDCIKGKLTGDQRNKTIFGQPSV